jgi:hypothetical protein
MNTPTEYQMRAQSTKARRSATYAKQREQRAAMKAYSTAITAWVASGKVAADKPQISSFWKW